MRFAAMPAVAVRRASLPATAQRWELRWLVLASGYNRLFSSRRLRFLGDLQGCPAPRHSFVAEQGRTGATLSVFHLQPSDGLRGPVACAVLGRSGPAPRQVPRESWRASRTFLPLAGKTACGALRRHLASRRIRRRDAFQRDTGPAFERSLSRPASRRFYDDHHRSGTRARTDALRRCRHLFPARLDLLHSACHGRGARRRKVPVLFVSGRISDRSFGRYRSYLGAFGFFLRPFLKDVLSIASGFLMQGEKDAERIRALGAPADRVYVSGNLKYDLELPAPTPLSNWLEAEARRSGRSPIIVAGSVVATEEPLALIAFGTLQGEYPKALLVLAPRKPERFEATAEFIDESHRKFIRRSKPAIPGPAAKQSDENSNVITIPDDVTVLLLDSIGELASLYGLADGAFVGGSLVSSGGHN